MNKDWRLDHIWNEVAYKPNRPLEKRDYAYASELGYPLVDRYLKMKATPFTNPPNSRSTRKFLAGNVWEFVVKQILIASGIYKSEEIKCDAVPYKGLLSVHGRLDFIAGGKVEYSEAIARLSQLYLPEALHVVADSLIKSISGEEFDKKILEIKSISTFGMDRVEKIGAPIQSHQLQGYHYQKNAKIPAEIVYICKDDCRMAQFKIQKEVEKQYKADIEQITYYFENDKMPPPEPLAKFEPQLGKFSKNLGVEYSPYLTKIYGFDYPDNYRQSVSFVESWNRVIARYAQVESGQTTATGKAINITDKNKQVKSEIIKSGYDFDYCLQCKIDAGIDNSEEE